MDLGAALKECSTALNLFLNNRFFDSLAILKPWLVHWHLNNNLSFTLLYDNMQLYYFNFTLILCSLFIEKALHFSPSGRVRACTMQWATAASWWCRQAWPLNQRTWMLPWRHWVNHCRRAKSTAEHFHKSLGFKFLLQQCVINVVRFLVRKLETYRE